MRFVINFIDKFKSVFILILISCEYDLKLFFKQKSYSIVYFKKMHGILFVLKNCTPRI